MLVIFFEICRSKRRVGALLGVSLGAVAAASGASAAGTGTLHLRCTNPYGGAHWSIEINLDRSLVDAQPATITDDWIKWRDAQGGIYELERATGKLRLRAASSTGGYFLHYNCLSE